MEKRVSSIIFVSLFTYSAGFQVSYFDVDAQVFGDEFVFTNLFKNLVSFTYVS